MSNIITTTYYTVNEYKQPLFIQEFSFDGNIVGKKEERVSWESMRAYANGQFVDMGEIIYKTAYPTETDEFDSIIEKINEKKEQLQKEQSEYTDIESKVATMGYNPKIGAGVTLVSNVAVFLGLDEESKKPGRKFNKMTLRKIYSILDLPCDF